MRRGREPAMKQADLLSELSNNVFGLEKRVSTLEWEAPQRDDFLRKRVDKAVTQTRGMLTDLDRRFCTQTESTKGSIESLHSKVDVIQRKLAFTGKKDDEEAAGSCRLSETQAKVDTAVSSLRRALLATIMQVSALSEDIRSLKEDAAAGKEDDLIERALKELTSLRAEVEKIKKGQARLEEALKQTTRTIEPHITKPAPEKGGEKPPSLPFPTAAKDATRHINEISDNSTIVAGVVSGRAGNPVKNDDFGVAFSDGRVVSASVCDGVGSARNGGHCAELAARSFLVFSRSAAHRMQDCFDTHKLVRMSFDRALEAVAARGFHESTMIAAVMDALTGNLSLGWLGDGGALLISKNGVREILRQHRNESGEITRFISGDGRGGDEPEIEDISLQPGDVVLLASDGFADFELDHKILCSSVLGALKSGISAEQVCAKLVRDAMSAGADDNVTVALIGLCGPVSALNGHEPQASRDVENLADQLVAKREKRLVQVRGKEVGDREVKQVRCICAS